MLDELLGRAELKARIDELEEEAERLRERYESADERRAEAVRERQAAEERVNRLEDKVAELEGRVASDAGEGDLSFRGAETLRGERLSRVLDRLESVAAGPEGALSAMVAGGSTLPDAVSEAFGERAALVRRAAPCLAYTDDAGLVSAALVPPVAPDPFAAWEDGFRVERSWFEPSRRFALALVRADLFALGEYDGRERVAFRGFESDVKGAHSKGGFSQRRFERLRDEQVREHVSRCRDAIDAREADRLYVVGDERLVEEFADAANATAAVDATGDPDDALDEAFADFFTTRLHLV